ncbi:hypothetical protein [Pseudarthrobacter sp. C4D7]|uniref:hypothetical protein n=1 Tax=Pseudarthrobacter sp. C4D7 TaxID=2735268 RepID=UPI00158569A4|nr:hypothetical protein [Pseudarthrobacter sp. C4D7]NUT71331.1 hypothetical protein [Pseudarthrobacter sp. C4D7]
MTTRAVASLFRLAWLFAAALAVIAGLLGMHVLTAGHASHGGAPHGPAQAAMSQSAIPHAAAGHGGHALHASALDTPASAACGGSCPGAQESGAPCIPSAPSGPVSVTPPQATLAVLPLLPAASGAGSGYGYLPPSPTPCELSISRT